MKNYVAFYNTKMGIQKETADFQSILKKINVSANFFKLEEDASKEGYLEANNKVFDVVKRAYNSNKKTICFTEDHSLVAGIFGNLAEDSGLVYIDAHADFHSFKTSASQRPHGMSLGTFMGLEDGVLKGNVNPENLVMLGLKDYETEEIDNLRNIGVKYVFGYDENTNCFYNIFDNKQKTYQEILDLINKVKARTQTMGLSFDLDALNKKEFSGAHYFVGNLPIGVCKSFLTDTKNHYSLVEITELNTYNNNAKDLEILQSIIEII